MSRLPDRASAVIIGGGIAGCSTAYHLAKLGWSDVVLLERRQLTCGTTWHAAGLVGQLRATEGATRLARYTAELYARLEGETGQATGFKQNGSLALATHDERFEELKRGLGLAKIFDIEAHVVGPSEAKSLWPHLNSDDLVGAIYLPKDGQTNPGDTALALARGARNDGVRIFENTKVTALRVDNGRVRGVSTDDGDIAADCVVNCGGMWAHELAREAGVNVPLQPCEHFYVVTEPIEGLRSDLPVLRDADACLYFKEDAGKLLFGAFEPTAKPWLPERIPEDFAFDELPEDLEHFEPFLEAAVHRAPALKTVGIRKFFNGPESFTPDCRHLLGEAPGLQNYFIAAGFNSTGIGTGGGLGWAIAEWIDKGHPPLNLWEVDVRRMVPCQGTKAYLRDRAVESPGTLYAMHWPHRQFESARPARVSPLHDRLTVAGACFGEAAGWERANWFAPEDVRPEYRYSYKRQNWFPYSAAEHEAVRTAVGCFDQSAFAKFLVQGRDSEAVLQGICANDVAVPPGRVIYTPWLNERGGIEADVTVTRLREDRYLIVSSAGSQVRDFDWLNRHIPPNAHAVATDITSAFAVLGVMGPNSRSLLSEIVEADFGNDTFPFGAAREFDLAYARVLGLRVSYAGELGWELYVPSESARGVFDAIRSAGERHGLKLAGLHAMDSLRIEKAFRHWGHDITDEDTPVEAGLLFACRPDKETPFPGQGVLRRQRKKGVTRRLVQFALEDAEPLLYHNEPIYRDGRLVGYICSGSYGHTLGRAVGLGYVGHTDGVDRDFVLSGTYEIEVACERIPASASLAPMYDAAGERMRS